MTDIVTYMRTKGFRLKAVGSVYRSFCPFPDHRESKPSFTLYPHNNTFHCFGCKKTGGLARLMRLFGDPVPATLAQEERVLRQETDLKYNPVLRDKLSAAQNALIRVRVARAQHKNAPELNAQVYQILRDLEAIKIDISTHSRLAHPFKKRHKV